MVAKEFNADDAGENSIMLTMLVMAAKKGLMLTKLAPVAKNMEW